jgi:hypothetical protein
MTEDFDVRRIAEIPDPAAGLTLRPLPPRRAALGAPPPTRDRVVRGRVLALALALGSELVWLAALRWRGDLTTTPPSAIAAEVGVPLAAGVLALLVAVDPGERGLGVSRERLAWGAIGAPVLFAVAAWLERVHDVDPQPFATHAAGCFLLTSLFALVPALLAARSFRGAFAAAPAWRSASLGVACGGLGAATMGLLCSTATAAHVIVGHASVLVVAGLAFAWVGQRAGQA